MEILKSGLYQQVVYLKPIGHSDRFRLRSDIQPNLYQALSSSGQQFLEGYQRGSVTAAYTHAYFGHPQITRHFLATALQR